MSEELKEQVQGLVDTAKMVDSPHVNIGDLLGASHPIYLGVDDLHNVLLAHQPPGLKLQLNNTTSVTVTCSTSGDVLATLQIVHF